MGCRDCGLSQEVESADVEIISMMPKNSAECGEFSLEPAGEIDPKHLSFPENSKRPAWVLRKEVVVSHGFGRGGRPNALAAA
ncbi:MAG: hypothetical protein DMG09_05025 [Acidobacteria bacterium]|nr:MAG: hypothetical protein DMG09_05025 [Acidobacteriota bacterium]